MANRQQPGFIVPPLCSIFDRVTLSLALPGRAVATALTFTMSLHKRIANVTETTTLIHTGYECDTQS